MLRFSRRADIVRTMPGHNAQDLFSSGEGWEDWDDLDEDLEDDGPALDPPPLLEPDAA